MSTRFQSSSYFRGRGIIRRSRDGKPPEEDYRKAQREEFVMEVDKIVEIVKSSHLPNRMDILSDIHHIKSRIPHTSFGILRGDILKALEKILRKSNGNVSLELELVMISWPKD